MHAHTVDRAARKSRRAGVDVRWDRGFADALPHPDATFQLVLSSMTLRVMGRLTTWRANAPALRDVDAPAAP